MSDDEHHADSTESDELPSACAELRIEKISLSWDVQVPFMKQTIKMETATSPRGVVTLALASVVVTAIGGGIAAALRALGFPVWAALAMVALSYLTFAATYIAEWRRAIRTAGTPAEVLPRDDHATR
jgi:hypothetical protein